MKWEWSYRLLPLKPRQVVGLVLLILLSFWAQSGFRLDRNHLIFFLANYSTWLLLLPSVYEFSKHVNRPYRWWYLIGNTLLLIGVHWLISNLILYGLRFLSGEMDMRVIQEIKAVLLPSLASRIIDLALFTGLLSWLHQQNNLNAQRVLMAENQALLERSKLQLLKNQLNPHFLFNALHSINSLIGIEEDRARDLVIKMSRLLRKMLTINELDEHTVGDEVDFVAQYLEIESERFSDRLQVDFQTDAAARPLIIPTMILQPLVENAFKHGISKIAGPTQLEVKVKQEAKALILLVVNDLSNTKVLNKADQGIGLLNLEDRLMTYYQTRATLETHEQNKRFEAKITILL